MTLTVAAAPATPVVAATSVVSAYPTGYSAVDGDAAVLIILSKHRTESTVPATPTGWTLLGTGLGGVTGAAVDAGKIRCTVFTRVLAAGVAAPTVGQTSGTGNLLGAFIYIARKSAAGTYTFALNVLSEATSSTSWSEALAGVPDWLSDDLLILPVGATTDAVTGFTVGTLTATGLTVGAITERIDAATTVGDDARLGCADCFVTAGPPTVAPTRAVTLSGVGSTGVMAVIRVRHVPAPVDALITPEVVQAVATFGIPIVTSPAAAFTVGQSVVGGLDALGVGAPTQVWVTLLPQAHVATVSFGQPMLWGPPSGLAATPLSSSSIRLTWNPVLSADGYNIERDGVVIAIDFVGTQYDDIGLAPETAYDYRVRAVR